MTNKREDDSMKSLQNNFKMQPQHLHSCLSLRQESIIHIFQNHLKYHLDFCEMTNKREDDNEISFSVS